MKFALVTETYAPEMNGVAMTLERIAQEFIIRGHEVSVIRPKQFRGDVSRTQNRLSHLTMAGAPLPGYKGLRFGFPNILKLRRCWAKNRPDVVHVATEGPLGLAAACVARHIGIPVISSFHTNFHAYSKHYRFGFLQRFAIAYLRFFHNRTAATFCPSHDLIASLADLRFKNLKHLGRGVDTDKYTPNMRCMDLREKWGAKEHDLVAIHVGRLAREKNIPLVLDAYRKAKEAVPSLKMVLVGDGPERAQLEKAYPEVHFSGVRRGDELAQHYASGDLFLFGSQTETFGNVVTEAMACGLLVVAFDYAAPRQYIKPNRNGRLVPFGDAEAFVDTVRAIAVDTSRHEEMRKAARETVLGVSWTQVIDRFEQAVQDQISTPNYTALPRKSTLSSYATAKNPVKP